MLSTRKFATGAITIAALALAPAAAHGDVLVNQGPSSIACGDDIQLGVWYQSYSGGPRWATMTVKSIGGHNLASKRVTATTSWRYWYYSPRCGHHYKVVYVTPGGRVSYWVHVRS